MAFKAGKGAFIALDNVAGSPVDISAFADQLDFPLPVDTLDTTTFGDNDKDMIPGLAGGAVVSASGPLDVALGTFLASLRSAQAAGSTSATIQYGPGGSISGQIKRSAEVYITAYNISTSVAGRVEYTASLQVTGATTDGTW